MTDGGLESGSSDGRSPSGSGGRPTDGGLDARAPDGGSDGAVPVPSCIPATGGGVTPWPASIPSSTAPECNPNCDATQCSATCPETKTSTGFTGAACDTGCCSASQVQPFTGGYNGTRAAITYASAVDASGTLHAISIAPNNTAAGVFYYEQPASGPLTGVANLDCQSPFLDPGSGSTYCQDYPGDPQIAVAGPAGQTVVYVVYVIFAQAENPLPRKRFGMKSGGQWSFEDLPLGHGPLDLGTGQLKVDPGGHAWILADGLYRRRSTSGWESMPVPCGASFTSFDFDASGVAYFGTGKNQIWRRDPQGAWSMEATPATAEKVFAAGGTVHYTGLGGTKSQDGAPEAWVHYGRRVGTTWSAYDVYTGSPTDYFSDYAVAFDPCGAPHLAIAAQQPRYIWSATYVRWTAAGWRSTFVSECYDPPRCDIRVGTSSAAVDCYYAGGSVPLR